MPVHVTSGGWQEYTRFWGKMLGLNIHGCVAKDTVPHVVLNADGNTYFLLPRGGDAIEGMTRMGVFSEMLQEYGRLVQDPDLGRSLVRRFHFMQPLQTSMP